MGLVSVGTGLVGNGTCSLCSVMGHVSVSISTGPIPTKTGPGYIGPAGKAVVESTWSWVGN